MENDAASVELEKTRIHWAARLKRLKRHQTLKAVE